MSKTDNKIDDLAAVDEALEWITSRCLESWGNRPKGYGPEFALSFMILAYCAGREAGKLAAEIEILGNDPGQAGEAMRQQMREKLKSFRPEPVPPPPSDPNPLMPPPPSPYAAPRTPPTSAYGVHDNPIIQAVIAEIETDRGSDILRILKPHILDTIVADIDAGLWTAKGSLIVDALTAAIRWNATDAVREMLRTPPLDDLK